jgi:hypothetical protein
MGVALAARHGRMGVALAARHGRDGRCNVWRGKQVPEALRIQKKIEPKSSIKMPNCALHQLGRRFLA